VLLCLAAFLAAFALAILSLKAFDDLDTFLTSDLQGGSCVLASEVAADVTDETLDMVDDGDVRLGEGVDEGFLVFLITNGRSDRQRSVAVGSAKA
jgi:hypothetical protein